MNHHPHIEMSITVAKVMVKHLHQETFDPQGIEDQANFISHQLDHYYAERGWEKAGTLMHDTMNKLHRLTQCNYAVKIGQEGIDQLRKDSMELLQVLEAHTLEIKTAA